MNHTAITGLENWLSQQIIGQTDLVRKLLIAVLADGHLLVEGAPGLAKNARHQNDG
jgi:MoxR-like ATPase